MAKNAQQYIVETFNRARDEDGKKSVGKDDLTVWGGNFHETQLETFLNKWSDYEWCFIECVDEFAVKKANETLYNDANHVERVRLFNAQGDLDIRRDEHTFYWRFIGVGKRTLPLAPFQYDNFWDDYPDLKFLPVEHSHYQWRKGDERVALDLSNHFPNLKGGETDPGIYLKQIHYLDNGNIAFVQYVDFEEDNL